MKLGQRIPAIVVILLAAGLAIAAPAGAKVRSDTVFFAGLPKDDGFSDATDASERLRRSTWGPAGSCPSPGNVAKVVKTERPVTLAGFSYGRLGPPNFIKKALDSGSQRLKNLRTVIVFDPGSTEDFSACDAPHRVALAEAYAAWLRMDKANRLVIMAGAATFDLDRERTKLMGALREVYLKDQLQTVTREPGRGKQVLVCNVEKDGWPFKHGHVIKTYASMIGDGRRRDSCPSDFVGWRPNTGHPYAGRIIQLEADRKTTWTVDAGGFKHHIPNGGTYECLKKRLGGHKLLIRKAVDLIPTRDDASCPKPFGSGAPPAPEPSEPAPAPPAGGTAPSQADGRRVTLAQGPAGPQGYRYAIRLSGFAAGKAVTVTCHDSIDSGGFFTFTMTTDGGGNAYTESQCYSADGPDHWIRADGVESNHVAWTRGPAATPPSAPPPSLWNEQQGSLGANTFLNPHNASGMGTKIQPYQWVSVSCKVHAPYIASANPDGYWYRIASAPWNNAYYAVANTFWNGDIPGQRPYTHFTDWSVPNC